ncbi:MAG: P-loop NTPase fold protein [Pseudomonadota bacterium]
MMHSSAVAGESNVGPAAGPGPARKGEAPGANAPSSAHPSVADAAGAAVPRSGLARTTSWLLLAAALLLGVLAAVAGIAQAPHPDAGRDIAPWAVGRLDWWAHPLERNAAKRVVIQGHLDGVHVMPDGRSLWVVGSRGLILHSADGGVSWDRRLPAAGPGPQAPRPAQAAGLSWISQAHAAPPAPEDPRLQQDIVQQAAPKYVPNKSKSPAPASAKEPAAQQRADPAPAAGTPAPVDPLTADLHDVTFIDERRGWAVGDGGIVLATRDGGLTWAPQPVPSGARLMAVSFEGDQRKGYVFGEQRVVLDSSDGGNTWQPTSAPLPTWLVRGERVVAQRRWRAGDDGQLRSAAIGSAMVTRHFDAGAPLRDLVFDAQGQRGWAVGDHGTVIATRDGGQTWFRQSAGITARQPGSYARYPAPWTWPVALGALGLLAVVMLRGFQPRPEAPLPPPTPVLPALSSDQPLSDLKDDRLGYRSSVLALSDFLRNSSTDPKLTLAITAPWGMGKTSIMGMLRNELHKAGFRTAWFNAWHHQQEGRPLNALFNTIRTQAVPSVWREPVAALRVRSRLLWGRGWAYRLALLLVGVPLAVLVTADLEKGRRSSGLDLADLLAWNFVHHVLQEPRVAITPASLAQLTVPTPGAAPADPCADDSQAFTVRRELKVRPAVYCYMRHALVLQGDGRHHLCNDKRTSAARPCVFESREALIDTMDQSLFGAGGAQQVLPSERTAIVAAAEAIAPPPLLPTVEHLLPLMALLGLLLTKGFAVYGLEVLKPLTRLFAKAERNDGSSEPTGTIERYRREFCLLTQALDGRLVVFIDDLDRCEKGTVNSILEMSNYLIDHGRCFIVLGAAMDQVKAAISVPDGHGDPDAYRVEYLRKLVHIELPVPQPGEAGLAALLRGHAEAPPPASHAPAWQRLRGLSARAGQAFQRHAGWALALVAGVTLAGAIADLVRRPEVVERIAAASPAAAPAAAGTAASADALLAAGATSSGGTAEAVRAPFEAAVGVHTGAPSRGWLAWAAVLGALVLSGAWTTRQGRTTLQTLTVALGGALRTQDSAGFSHALALWRRAVRMYDATPRGLKRFCNRARLFAIVERLAAGEQPTPEHHVVALTALHHVSPALVGRLTAALDNEADPATGLAWRHCDWPALERLFIAQAAALHDTWTLLLGCLKEHASAFGGLPDAEAVRRFNALLGRISVR